MHPPAEDAREIERRWLAEVASRGVIRVAVRALIVLDEHILLQRLAYPEAYWYFPGGALELGEQLEAGVRRELAEETTLDIARIVYRFTANNRFERDGHRVHSIEHYFEVTPVSPDVTSLEDPQVLEWHPLDRIRELDIRPWGVRDILGISGWRSMRLLEVE
jgi:ADP-ribose pyrophosphatase YjhB (NUDIX family)